MSEANSTAQPNQPPIGDESQKRLVFPVQFLSGLSEEAGIAIEQYFKAFMLPKAVFGLINEYSYIQTLMNRSENPEEFRPDGLEGLNREIEGCVKSIAWLIEDVEQLTKEKVQSLSPAEYKKASKYNLFQEDPELPGDSPRVNAV